MDRLERLKRLFLKNCQHNNLPGVNQCLSRGINVNTSNEYGTGLMLACEPGHTAIVTRLLQVPGMEINYQIKNGTTAAHLVSARGRTECARLLAETGRVDWNLRGSWGRTPLYLAIEMEHPRYC